MTVFNPEWRVKVNGTTVTHNTLANLFITSGRQSIYDQPAAGYCQVNLLTDPSQPVTAEINDPLTIEVKDSSGTYVSLFGGYVSDVSLIVTSPGATQVVQEVRITGIGALARLVRGTFTGNLASDQDGDQIYVLLEQLLLNNWDETPAGITWNDYNPTTTWANAENTGLGEIDRPGDYDMEAQNDLNGSIYQYASAIATSGLGYLYEDAQGRICYADSTHRAEYLSANGYVELDANQAYGAGLEITKRSGDVRNKIVIGYGSSNSFVTDQDDESMVLYGQLASSISTNLKNQSDAEAQAAFYLALRSYPQYQFNRIVFPLGNPELDDTDRDALLNVFMGMPVSISNLPNNMNFGQFQGFVEGWTLRAGVSNIYLEMTISPLAFSIQALRWELVNAAETWNTLSTTLDWDNATIVA